MTSLSAVYAHTHGNTTPWLLGNREPPIKTQTDSLDDTKPAMCTHTHAPTHTHPHTHTHTHAPTHTHTHTRTHTHAHTDTQNKTSYRSLYVTWLTNAKRTI